MSEKRFFESMYEIFDRKYGRKLQGYEIIDLLNELNDENGHLKKENEMLKKWLLLYDEDEVDKYLRTHPMPSITITTKRRVIPLGMRHKEC